MVPPRPRSWMEVMWAPRSVSQRRHPWDFCGLIGIYMVFIWCLVGFIWCLCGVYMVFSGIYMVFIWDLMGFSGIYMVIVWGLHGVYTGFNGSYIPWHETPRLIAFNFFQPFWSLKWRLRSFVIKHSNWESPIKMKVWTFIGDSQFINHIYGKSSINSMGILYQWGMNMRNMPYNENHLSMKIPYNENHLSMGNFTLPCLITRG